MGRHCKFGPTLTTDLVWILKSLNLGTYKQLQGHSSAIFWQTCGAQFNQKVKSQ